MKKNSLHIRIKQEDGKVWKEYCKTLGESSPSLFSKIIKSKELNLNDRILNELKKKEMQMKRRLMKK